jgi:hypothetical protein
MDIALLTLLIAGRTTAVTYIVGGLLGALYGELVILGVFALDSSDNFEIWHLLPLLVFMTLAALIGLVIGSILGAISGAATGIVTAAITILAFFPLTPNRAPLYRAIITIAGIIISCTTIYLLAFPLFRWVFPQLMMGLSSIIYTLMPAVIAGLGAWWIGGRMAKWYERQPQNSPQYEHLSAEAGPESPVPAQISTDLDKPHD